METNKLALFDQAMQKVYGPYNTDSPNPTWQPPNTVGTEGDPKRRLSCTDAFGIVNFITLSRESPSHSAVYLELAKRLVETVHDVLGRTRDGSARLRGASDDEPLKGGLRIGKVDEEGDDCDGQYHHYLTLWMFALNRLALATGEARWNDLAVQLAKAIDPHFVQEKFGRQTMVWKFSTDMQHVLVPSKGHLDDVDGYMVYRLLQETSTQLARGDETSTASLDPEIDSYRHIMAGYKERLTGDPLDLGMGLWISHFDRDAPWSRELSSSGLEVAQDQFVAIYTLPMTAKRRLGRLAFRDFGVCMGIKCYGGPPELLAGVGSVLHAWENKLDDEGGADLRPINLVMYAAALFPGAFRRGYLELEATT